MKLVCYHVTKKILVTMIVLEMHYVSFKNAQGRIVGFSGRTYNNQEPKYLVLRHRFFKRDDYFIILIAQESQLEK